jgi:hypothetical protein
MRMTSLYKLAGLSFSSVVIIVDRAVDWKGKRLFCRNDDDIMEKEEKKGEISYRI